METLKIQRTSAKVYIPLLPKHVEVGMSVRINADYEGNVAHSFDDGKFINVAPFEGQTVNGLQMVIPNRDLIHHIVEKYPTA